MSDFLQRARRWLSVGVCAALTAAVVCMAVAVLVQALAVLVIAALAASLLLPHPLKWYAKEGAEAIRLFVNEIFAPARQDEDTTSADAKNSGAATSLPARSDASQSE